MSYFAMYIPKEWISKVRVYSADECHLIYITHVKNMTTEFEDYFYQEGRLVIEAIQEETTYG